jgi:hypothetical protein
VLSIQDVSCAAPVMDVAAGLRRILLLIDAALWLLVE